MTGEPRHPLWERIADAMSPLVSDTEIVEANAREMRRSIMGRLAVVEHELVQMLGEIDDLPKPRDAEIDLLLGRVMSETMLLRALLVEKGWR